MSDVDKAERVSIQRAVIFYLLAGVLVLSLIVTGSERDPIRLLPWFFVIALGTANLFTVGLIRSAKLKSLMNDETTKRRNGIVLSRCRSGSAPR